MIFFEAQSNNFFILPHGASIAQGQLEVLTLEGETQFVDADSIAPFACSAQEVDACLVDNYQSLLKATGNAFRHIAMFSALRHGRDPAKAGETAESTFSQLMRSMLGQSRELPTSAKLALEAAEGLKNRVPAASEIPIELAAFFSGDDQNALSASVMSRLRAIAGKLDASVLQENDNPAAWVDVLYRQLFSDEIEKSKKMTEKQIRASVSQSIADGLREQGIKPSADFDREIDRAD